MPLDKVRTKSRTRRSVRPVAMSVTAWQVMGARNVAGFVLINVCFEIAMLDIVGGLDIKRLPDQIALLVCAWISVVVEEEEDDSFVCSKRT